MSFFCSRIQSKTQHWIQQAFLLIHHRHPGTWGKPIFYSGHPLLWAFLVAQTVKSLPAMWETPVQSLGREKEMETCSSILAWKIPLTEEPRGIQLMGHRVGYDWATNNDSCFLQNHKGIKPESLHSKNVCWFQRISSFHCFCFFPSSGSWDPASGTFSNI